jgi:hypothetical protein
MVASSLPSAGKSWVFSSGSELEELLSPSKQPVSSKLPASAKPNTGKWDNRGLNPVEGRPECSINLHPYLFVAVKPNFPIRPVKISR